MELGNLKSLKIVAVLMCVVLISYDRLRGLIELVLYCSKARVLVID